MLIESKTADFQGEFGDPRVQEALGPDYPEQPWRQGHQQTGASESYFSRVAKRSNSKDFFSLSSFLCLNNCCGKAGGEIYLDIFRTGVV